MSDGDVFNLELSVVKIPRFLAILLTVAEETLRLPMTCRKKSPVGTTTVSSITLSII